MNGQAGNPAQWVEARNESGRLYYYLPGANPPRTQWNKPPELMSPEERAILDSGWTMYTAEGGKPYWAHPQKATTYDTPQEVEEIRKRFQTRAPPPFAPPPSFVAGGQASRPQFNQHRDRDEYQPNDRMGQDRQGGYRDSERNANPVALSSQTDPEYNSLEEAEAAFMKLLKRVNAQPEWSWEQTVRATVKDPQYRSLKDPKDRKAAFEKYVVEVRAQEKDKEKERLAKMRLDFTAMLKSHPEIKHYTRWRTARGIIEDESIFRSAKNDDERRQLFEEYIVELKKLNLAEEATNRSAALEELMEILRALNLEPYTRWSTAQEKLQSVPHFKNDKKLQLLTKLDTIKAFDNHIKALERAFNDQRQKEKALKTRRERKAREGFVGLLKELKAEGKINAGSKWMDIHPLVEDDPRYVAMLGNSGSSPQELFWDSVEEDETALNMKRSDVMDVLEEKRYEVTTKTTFDEFLSVISTDYRTAALGRDILKVIFKRIYEKVLRRNEAEKHLEDRRERNAMDNLRSKMKRLQPPIVQGDTWDQVRPRIEKFEEYGILDSDELRRSAFDKYMRRLKKDDEDRERSARDHRPRDRGDRHSHRDRERDYRDGHDSHRRRRTRTRSPEIDAYEADRKKAIETREKQYHRNGVSSTVLSSPHRRDRDDRRDRADRYDRSDRRGSGDRYERERRGSRQVSLSHYDHERREREAERERDYVSRADPRERSSTALNYGDSQPGSMRRRRDSDVGSPGSRRDNKRPRRSRTPAVPPTPAPAPEDPGLRSGSEEGELAED